ncbi:hypothetical protein RJT34_06655 [Clitoria ternatea]|uniref:Uncharacterized protein n=1 Tax=Clitoria ternatea TaxID=43366 RepID=A0AAN9PTT1_CLITE
MDEWRQRSDRYINMEMEEVQASQKEIITKPMQKAKGKLSDPYTLIDTGKDMIAREGERRRPSLPTKPEGQPIRENTHITMTGRRGTRGYAAPELWMPFLATHK